MILVCLAWQDGLVVGNCLSRAVISHNLLLSMPDGFQSLFLLWSQTLMTNLHRQALSSHPCIKTCLEPQDIAFAAMLMDTEGHMTQYSAEQQYLSNQS